MVDGGAGGGLKVRSEHSAGVARIWIERPEVHNAFDDEVILQLTGAVEEAAANRAVRAIVIGGRGKSFSAGADLNWMRGAADYSEEDNRADAGRLAKMLRTLSSCRQVTIARVHGAALGGGLGLVVACDVSIAAERASMGFSEVKLGLLPAVISPYVIERVGPGRARELFVTGERVRAARAAELGLISQVVADEAALDAAIDALVEQVRANSPDAIAQSKELVQGVIARAGAGPDEVDAYTAEHIARARASDHGKEGLTAFLEKRPPGWAL
jgi:methylglutaconyl-CoA hydratase